MSPAARRNYSGALRRALFFTLLLLSLAGRAAADTSATDGTTPSSLMPGAPAGSYKLDGFGVVNLFNGNLDFNLPLSDIIGRGAARAALTLPVERRWRTGQYTFTSGTGYPTTITYATHNWWGALPVGYGPGNIQGRSTSPQPSCGSTLFRLTFTSADGTEYELRDQLTGGKPGGTTVVNYPYSSQCVAQQNRGTVFVTADGSAATFISDVALNDSHGIGGTPYKPSGYLLFRDGTRYRFDNALVTWIRDRNGNMVTFGYDANGRVIAATDSLNRQVTVAYDVTQARPYGQCDQPGYSCDEITYNGSGGTARTVRITKTTLSNALRSGYSVQNVNTLFPEYWGSSPVNPTITSAVWLPNGQAYKLYYNSYVELARVELPTGGAIEYDHLGGFSTGPQSGANGNMGISRRVVESRTYTSSTSQASLISKTTFSRPESVNQSGALSTVGYVDVDHRDAAGTLSSRERHYFYGSASSDSNNPTCSGYTHWQKGREYQTDSLGSDGVTLLRRVTRTWQQRATLSWWASWNSQTFNQCASYEPSNDPRIVETVTTLADTNQVTKQSAINPQTGAVGFDQYNNPTDTWVYDYGSGAAGPLLRRTETAYLYAQNGVAYDTLNPAATPDINSTIHVRSLPLRQSVYDAGGVERSRTVYEYDNYSTDSKHAPLTARANITGLCDTVNAQRQCVLSNPTAFTARGNVTAVTNYADAAGLTGAVSAFTQYDVAGNVVASIDANGNKTTTGYDDSFCNGSACGGSYTPNTYAFATRTTSPIPDASTAYGFPAGSFGSTSALNSLTAYDFWTGRVSSATDANGKTTTFEYNDALDRATAQVRPGPTGGRIDVEYHDTVSDLYVRVRADLDDSRRTETREYFDGLGRGVRSFTLENQDAANPWLVVDTQYDALGRAWSVSNPYRTATATPGSPSTINPSGLWNRTGFDALGRARTATTPDGAVVATDYSGDRTLVKDQAGKERVSRTDALGRLAEVWEITASDSSTVALTSFPGHPEAAYGYRTVYTYDVLGNMRSVQQAGAQGVQNRTFVYDSLARLTSATNPESGITSYTYDPAGNIQTKTDARGVTATYRYDYLNRNIITTYAIPAGSGVAATPETRRHYDGATNGLGRLHWSESVGLSATVFDAYDALGLPTQYHQVFWSNNAWGRPFNVARTYDKAGHVLTETYPSGHQVTYGYDAAGRVASFSGGLGDGVSRSYTTGVNYAEFGGIRQEQFGTQTPLHHKQRYNSRGQLYDVRLSTGADADSWNRGMLVNHYGSGDFNTWGTSGPNNNGNVLRAHHYVPNDDQVSGYKVFYQDYEYDALNRLSKVTEQNNIAGTQYVQQYNHDRWGNRTINQGLTWGVPEPQFELAPQANQEVAEPSNRLYAPGDSGRAPSQKLMRYDAAGNLVYDAYTGAGGRVYDAESRMMAAVDRNGVWAYYTYDADGRRIKRKIANDEWWQVYGIDGELLAEYPASAASFLASKEYGYRGGQLLVTMSSGDADRLRRFVKNLYYNSLSRDPSASELGAKIDQLSQAGVQGGETQLLSTARSVARSLFESAEYVARGRTTEQYVTDLYNAYLQRGPDTGGLNHWVGNTNQNGRGATLNAFEVSGEFFTLSATVYGTTSGGDDQRVDGFVRSFYLGAFQREPTATEAQAARLRLNNATTVSRDQVIAEARLMGGELFQATGYNSTHTVEQYVTDLYQAFLQRAPDAGGLNHWVGNTNQNGRAATLEAFKGSIEYTELAGTLYRETFWLVADHLGTPRMVVQKSGSLAGVKRHDYLPFGEELYAGQGGRATQQGYSFQDNVRQKFTNYERDGETGLDYAQARYYGSDQGRFTSADPLGASAKVTSPQTFNRYTHALNNPVRYTDPSGLDAEDYNVRNFLIGTAASDSLNQSQRSRQAQQQPQQQKPPRVVYIFVTFTLAEQQANVTNHRTGESIGTGPAPDFQSLVNSAPKGTTVRLIQGEDATVEGFNNALQDPNAAGVFFIGHGMDNEYPSPPFTADGINFGLTDETRESFDQPVQVKAQVVGVFACDSQNVSGLFQISGSQSFIGMNSGANGLTTTPALSHAGFAAARQTIMGRSPTQSVTAANRAMTLKDDKGAALNRTATDKGDSVRKVR